MLVRKLESGQTDIDYKEFRESFLESSNSGSRHPKGQIRPAESGASELMAQSKYSEIVQTTKKILSIDYTNMHAHKVLQQTYKALKDEANRQKYHDIDLGS